MKTKNMTTLHLKESIGRSPLRLAFLLILLALACLPTALAVTPAPDGGYPNENTAEGDSALFSLTTGTQNTANGFEALFANTTGNENTATGYLALFNNQTAAHNTANGFNALFHDTTGGDNTATGSSALFNNHTGLKNTAYGNNALLLNKTGNGNTASGDGALESNTGSFNVAVGFNAGGNLTTGSNNIDIGALGVAGESSTMRIGTVKQTATYVTGISGAIVASGATVIVRTDGHLGTVVSSARFKEAIKPMDKASEAILALQPVTFRYKHELDPEGIPQFGLVAEQVEKVNPDLVARDAEGKVYTVRYEAVNAMLLNEFLKQHCKVEAQEATITQLKQDSQSKFAEQQKQIKALTSGLEKVNNQLELSKPAPQMVGNNQ
jgi:Chaperone of endosialidase